MLFSGDIFAGNKGNIYYLIENSFCLYCRNWSTPFRRINTQYNSDDWT